MAVVRPGAINASDLSSFFIYLRLGAADRPFEAIQRGPAMIASFRPLVHEIATIVAIAVLCPLVRADIPPIISYQGKATDSGGNPVPDGNYNIRFRIYDDPVAGNLKWDSGTHSESVSDGVFSVLLGEAPHPSIGLPFDDYYWLLVTFAGVDQTPRQQLASTGYAYMANGLVPGTVITGSTYYILKAVNTDAAGFSYGMHGEAGGDQGTGVYGYATSTSGVNFGVYGRTNSTGGRGIFGWANATTGTSYAVRGYNKSVAGTGISGEVDTSSGTTYGVHGEVSSPAGYGVYGLASSSGGYAFGVYGKSESTLGRGVFGWATATSGFTYGVGGESDSPSGRGVWGWASATTSTCTGVYGESSSTSGYGVHGKSPFAGGFFDDTSSSSSARVGYDTYKIWGTGTPSFVQNHPVLSNRVIVYAAPEGDEVATYTRGRARLSDGVALIKLGETFKFVTNPDIGLTAHLTPRGPCHGLYVASLTTGEMVVRELEEGTSDVPFDFIVYGLRIGFEDVSIVQEKQEEAYIPSMAAHRERYQKHPELRRYSALQRFKMMRTSMGESLPDMNSSEILRNSIIEFDPAVHPNPYPGMTDAEQAATKAVNNRVKSPQPDSDEETLLRKVD